MTYVPDDNFEQELIALGLDSGPLNDSVLTSAIDTVQQLYLVLIGIFDLTGIEDFTALRSLNFKPKYSFLELVEDMVKSDLELAEEELI